MARRRPLRRACIAIAALLAILLIFIALLPTLISAGLGRGTILGALQKPLRGHVTLDELDLGWSGEQRAAGLKVVSEDARTSVDLTLGVDRGLAKLAWGGPSGATITIGGSLRGELRRDGSLSFRDLLAPSSGGDGHAPSAPPQETSAPAIETLPSLTVRIENLLVELTSEENPDAPMRLSMRDSSLALAEDGTIDGQLAAEVEAAGSRGTITLALSAGDWIGADRRIDLARASLDLAIAARDVALPFAEEVERIDRFEIHVGSRALGESVEVRAEGSASMDEGEPGVMRIQATVANVVGEGNALAFSPAAVTGEVHVERFATDILQPLFASTKIDLSEDIGPLLDLTARFGSGDERRVEIALRSEQISATIAALADARGGVRQCTGEILARVTPALFAAQMPGLSVDREMALRANLTNVAAPRSAGGEPQLALCAGEVAVEIQEPVTIAFTGDASRPSVVVESLVVRGRTDALVRGASITLQGLVNGLAIELRDQLTGIIGQHGSIQAVASRHDLDGTVTGIAAGTVTPWLPDPALAPIVRSIVKDGSRIVLATDPSADEDVHRVTLALGSAELTLEARRRENTLEVFPISGTVEIDPDLVRSLQTSRNGGEESVTLATPVRVTLRSESVRLPGRDWAGYSAPEPVVAVAIASLESALDLAVRGLHERIGVDRGEFRIGATIDQSGAAGHGAKNPLSLAITGQARVNRPEGEKRLADLAVDLAIDLANSSAPGVTGTLTLERARLAGVEALLGIERRTLTDWIGEEASIAAHLSTDTNSGAVDLGIDSPQIHTRMQATLDERVLAVTAEELTYVLARERIDEWINPLPDQSDSDAAPTGLMAMSIDADVPVTLNVRRIQIPRGLVDGTESQVDQALYALDVDVRSGPLVLSDATGDFAEIHALRVSLLAEGLRGGVQTDAAAEIHSGGRAQGAFELDALVDRLVGESGRPRTKRARLTGTLSGTALPTQLVDRLAFAGGMLVAALGPRVDAKITMEQFARDSGWTNADLITTNGSLRGRVHGDGRVLRILPEHPLTAELRVTPELSDRLLQGIHPIFADVKTTEQPIRLTVPGPFAVPTDGNPRRLDGDLALTVGKVELGSGSTLLGVLDLFEQSRQSVPGSIDPVSVHVKSGVVTCDSFTVRLARYAMKYEGEVNLVKREAKLKTQVPLDALGTTFHELEGYADGLIVPLVTHGKLGALKTEIDPEFDIAGAALEGGLRKGLEEIFKRFGEKRGGSSGSGGG